MKTTFLTLAVVATAGVLLASCKGQWLNSPPTPPGGSYFVFADSTQTSLMRYGRLTAERVDLRDTTKVVVSRALTWPDYMQYFDSKRYGFIFILKTTDLLLVKGVNKLRIFKPETGAPGGTRADWLEVTNATEEWVAPTQVKFNGRVIERVVTDEIASPSYLYVLK